MGMQSLAQGPDFTALWDLGPALGPASSGCERCASAGARWKGQRGPVGPWSEGGVTEATPAGGGLAGGAALATSSSPLPTDPLGVHPGRHQPPGPTPCPAHRDEVLPRASPRLEPAHRERGVRAGAAPAGSWTVRDQQTPNLVFKETSVRGGFWGFKFPQTAPTPVPRKRQPQPRSKGRSLRGRWAGLQAPAQWTCDVRLPVSPTLGAALVGLVSGPV